jgi:hypothetical protein
MLAYREGDEVYNIARIKADPEDKKSSSPLPDERPPAASFSPSSETPSPKSTRASPI